MNTPSPQNTQEKTSRDTSNREQNPNPEENPVFGSRFFSGFVMNMAGRLGAGPAFMMAAFLESLFVPFMIDALLFALVLRGGNLVKLAGLGLIASVLGTLCWYVAGLLAGPSGFGLVTDLLDISRETQDRAAILWADNWFLAILVAGLSTIPDPLVAVLAGMSGVSIFGSILAISASHILRFFLLAGFVWIGTRLARKTSSPWQRRLSDLSGTIGIGIGVVLGLFMTMRFFS